jgi:pimeloyl-ACP methyl ester carboxylesterase
MNTSRTAQLSTAPMTTGSVSSADGTAIGYLRVGRGPAVVILHGSNESARSHTQLALGLAEGFTVYLPDRRGRGGSGPHRAGHGLRTEVEDLQAILAEARADQVFSVSIGGLIALEAARVGPGIRQLALYEPAILTAADKERYSGWVPRFDQEMSQGRAGAAMITSMFGCDLAPPALKAMPRRLLEAMTGAAMKKEDAAAAPDDATMRRVAPTLRYEGLLLAETAGTVSTFAGVAADVLLMGGDLKRPAFLRPAFDAFARTLPHNRQARFPGLDHGASGDPGPANRGAQPAVLAPAIRSFFSQP